MFTLSKFNMSNQAEKARLVITSGPLSQVVTGRCSFCGSLFIRDDGNGDRLLDDFAEHIKRVHRTIDLADNPERERPL